MDIFVFDGEGSTLCDVLVQRLESLLFVLQVFRSADEFLNGFHIKKLVDIVVMSQEVRRDFSRPFELRVFSDYGLDLFDKCVFGVVAGDFESSVVRVLKFLSVGELDSPGRGYNGAVRSRLIKTDF